MALLSAAAAVVCEGAPRGGVARVLAATVLAGTAATTAGGMPTFAGAAATVAAERGAAATALTTGVEAGTAGVSALGAGMAVGAGRAIAVGGGGLAAPVDAEPIPRSLRAAITVTTLAAMAAMAAVLDTPIHEPRPELVPGLEG